MVSDREAGLSLFEMLLAVLIVSILMMLSSRSLVGVAQNAHILSTKIKRFEAREIVYHLVSNALDGAGFYPGLSKPTFQGKPVFLGVRRFACGAPSLDKLNHKVAKACQKGSDVLVVNQFNPRFLPVILSADFMRVKGVSPRLKAGDEIAFEKNGVTHLCILNKVSVNDQRNWQTLYCSSHFNASDSVVYRYEQHMLFLKDQSLYQVDSRHRLDKLIGDISHFKVALSQHFVEVRFVISDLESELIAPNPNEAA
jgi:hypothetical protein